MDPLPPRVAASLLLLSAGLLLAGAGCQPYYLLRPVPSDSLPIVGLKEAPDPLLDPGERDRNETELRGLLGAFDGRFLSVLPPAEDGAAAGEHPDELDAQLAKEVLDAGTSGPGLPGRKQRPSRKLRRRLQQWLRAVSSCPLAAAWSDLGGRFWPRFVRSGSCVSRRSCSVPEGMTCRPAASTHLTLLRWRCVQRKAGLRCAWIPVQYPVITDCKCACSD